MDANAKLMQTGLDWIERAAGDGLEPNASRTSPLRREVERRLAKLPSKQFAAPFVVEFKKMRKLCKAAQKVLSAWDGNVPHAKMQMAMEDLRDVMREGGKKP